MQPWRSITAAGKWGALSLGLIWLLLLVPITHARPDSHSELSRLAAVESLVERGTWAITDSDLARQIVDKASYRGEFYSDKTPLLTLLTAGLYYPTYHLFAAEIDAGKCTANDTLCSYWWFTYLMVGVPSALLLAGFYYIGRQHGLSIIMTLLVTAMLVAGTMVLPYSTVYNNHLLGAACAFWAFFLIIAPVGTPRNQRAALMMAGFLAGCSVSIDLPAIFLVIALIGLAAVHHHQRFFWFAGGLALPVMATVLMNYQIHESPFPIYFRPGVYAWEGSPWDDGFAGRQAPWLDRAPERLFHAVLGHHGILVTWPIVLLPLAGLVMQVVRPHALYRREAIAVLASLVLLLAYLLLVQGDFGGRAYGIRYMVNILPIWFFFAYTLIPSPSRVGASIIYWTSLVTLTVFSALSVVPATATPWDNWTPLFYLQPTLVRPHVELVTPFSEQPAQSMEAQIDGIATLTGFTLKPHPARPGELVLLRLYWRVDPTHPPGKVFVHLRDPSNQTVVQADHWLVGQAVPAEVWVELMATAESDTITKDIYLSLPAALPPGNYELLVGMYQAETGDRLRVVDDRSGENAINLQTLAVQ